MTASFEVPSGYIAEETLADDVELGAILSDDALDGAAIETLTLDDGTQVTVTLEKA